MNQKYLMALTMKVCLLACSYELMTLVAAEFISEATALFEQFQVNIDAKNWCLHLSRKS